MHDRLDDTMSKVSGGIVTYPPKGRLGPRMQPNIQLVMVHTGHVYIDIDEQTYLVPAGYVTLLCPGHRENFAFSETSDTTHSWIHFELTRIDPELIEGLEALPSCIPLSTQMNQLTTILIENLQQSAYRSVDQLVRSLAISLILVYQSECIYSQQQLHKHEAVLRAIEHIHLHYGSQLDLKKIATAANVSGEYLIRLFMAYEGITPIRYVWKIRVERVIELLLHSGLSLKEIAEKTGFQNTHHLSRMISLKTGMAPSHIRKQQELRG